MEAFLLGVISILTVEVSLFLILSFLLIGKLSNSFPSHLLKVLLLCLTTVMLYSSFILFGPTSIYSFFQSSASIVLILTVFLCLKFLGVFRSMKSEMLKKLVEGALSWVAPVVLGFWLFGLSLMNLGPVLGSMMIHSVNSDSASGVVLIPLFFGLGIALVVGVVLGLSWLFHNKFKSEKFWNVIQVLASVAAAILALRTLISTLLV